MHLPRYVMPACGLLLLLALPAFALPDYEIERTYFDAYGNEVGLFILYCNGSTSMTGTATEYYTEIHDPCNMDVPVISCDDVGLSRVDPSGNPCPQDWCVTTGYRDMWLEHLVTDCWGNLHASSRGRAGHQERTAVNRGLQKGIIPPTKAQRAIPSRGATCLLGSL